MPIAAGWTNLSIDKQELRCSASLSTPNMSYISGAIECSPSNKSCFNAAYTANGPFYAQDRTCGGCGGILLPEPSLDEPMCYAGVSPCVIDCSGIVPQGPPTQFDCPASRNLTRLLDQRVSTNRNFYVASSSPTSICYICEAACTLNRTCRGPVNLFQSMDLGSAFAWTAPPALRSKSSPNMRGMLSDDVKYLHLDTTLAVAGSMFNATADVRWDFEFVGFTNYVVLKSVADWANDLRTATNVATGRGCTLLLTDEAFANLVRDTAYIFASVNLVCDNFYASAPILSSKSFDGCDILASGDVQGWRDREEFIQHGIFLGMYTGVEGVKALSLLESMLGGLLKEPDPVTVAGKPSYLRLHISLKLAKVLLCSTTEEASAVASNMVSNFLRDFEGKTKRPGTEFEVTSNPKMYFPSATEAVLGGSVAFIGARMTHLQEGAVQYTPGGLFPVSAACTLLNPTQLVGQAACFYEVVLRIDEWSIMLSAYFQSRLGFVSPFDTSESVAPCAPYSAELLPRACVTGLDQATIGRMLAETCSIQYMAPSSTSIGTMTQHMLFAGATADYYEGGMVCRCYNFTFAPSGQRELQEAKDASHCFSDKCGQTDRDQLGLSDSTCSQPSICARMYEWVHSKNPSQQGVNLDFFSWSRFQLLCGNSIQPLAQNSFDWQMTLAIGGVCLCLVAITVSSRWARRLSRPKYAALLVGGLTLAVLVGALLGWILTGESFCLDPDSGNNDWPRKAACRSRVLGTPLLQQSCAFVSQCECQLDTDCGAGCVCPSGACVSSNGARATKRISKTTTEANIIAPVLMLAVTVPLLMMLWTNTWGASRTGGAASAKRWYITLGTAILVFVLLLAAALAGSIHTENGILEFDGPPVCGGNAMGPVMLSVLDLEGSFLIEWMSMSVWTPTGFGGKGRYAPPFNSFTSQYTLFAYDRIKAFLGSEFDTAMVAQELLFMRNDVNYPDPRHFFVLLLKPGSGRGNTIVASMALDDTEQAANIYHWQVAWGNVKIQSDGTYFDLTTVPFLKVSSNLPVEDSRLYSLTNPKNDTFTGQPEVVAPQKATAFLFPELFDAAKASLGGADVESKGLLVIDVLFNQGYKYNGYVKSADRMANCRSDFPYGPWVCTSGTSDVDIEEYTAFT